MKGGGCDCATFIAEVLIACGLAERENLGVYSQDWFFHTSNERYLRGLLSLSAETAETVAHRSANTQPGDIVLTRLARSKVYNHGAIVTAWPKVVHAISPRVEEIDASTHPLWAYRTVAVFTPKS